MPRPSIGEPSAPGRWVDEIGLEWEQEDRGDSVRWRVYSELWDPPETFRDPDATTILLEQVTPHSLGALIAFYEHRVFANAVLLVINPFDQFGVELGKEMAKGLAEGTVQFDPATEALMQAALGD